ncbi:MAG: hypothetical protein CMN59_08380 [Sphingobium sp.]|nr:hypothetical protein [Sphingobium sp.]
MQYFAQAVLDKSGNKRVAKVYLAGADRGCLRLAFLLQIYEQASALVTRENLSSAADFATVVGALWHALTYWTGGKSTEPDVSSEQAKRNETLSLAVQNDMIGTLQAMVNTMVAAGAEQVTASIPGYPDVLVSGAFGQHVALIGSQASRVNLANHYRGKISNFGGPLTLTNEAGDRRNLYWGNLQIPAKSVVAIEWSSQHPVGEALKESNIEVEGDMTPIDFDGWRATERIPQVLKSAVRLLTVRRCFVGI